MEDMELPEVAAWALITGSLASTAMEWLGGSATAVTATQAVLATRTVLLG